jgi:hypothetical protein
MQGRRDKGQKVLHPSSISTTAQLLVCIALILSRGAHHRLPTFDADCKKKRVACRCRWFCCCCCCCCCFCSSRFLVSLAQGSARWCCCRSALPSVETSPPQGPVRSSLCGRVRQKRARGHEAIGVVDPVRILASVARRRWRQRCCSFSVQRRLGGYFFFSCKSSRALGG